MDGYRFKNVSTLEATEPATGKDAAPPLLSFPQCLVGTPQGKLYILDRNTNSILTIEHDILVKLAGCGSGMRNGPASQALFQKPTSMCLSATNGVLIADSGNHAIRLLFDDEVTTFSGGNGQGKENGSSKFAKFHTPNAVALNPLNLDVLVCDSGNHCLRLISNAVVSDFAGCGEPGKSDGPAKEAKFRAPEGLLVTSTGDVIVADTQNHLLRLISDGMVTTLAGDGTPRFGDGSLDKCRFNGPTSLCLSPIGDVVVIDTGNSSIRLLSNGQVTTLAGHSGQPGFKDGSTSKCSFNHPTSAVWTRAGQLLVADGYNQRIRVLEDETHIPSPDFGMTIDLHEKPEKWSLMLGDFDVPMRGRTWHLQKCILQERCPEIVRNADTLAKLAKAKISTRSQRLFWLYIYRDSLPEGQFGGSSLQNIKDWLELLEIANIAKLERLANHCRWRASYLLSNCCDSKETVLLTCKLVKESSSDFTDALVDVLVMKKASMFGGSLLELNKDLEPEAYAKLLSKANFIVHPFARPTTSPQGQLGVAMEALCPAVISQAHKASSSSAASAVSSATTTSSTASGDASNFKITAEGHTFPVHFGVLVPSWPLIFTWFFTREHMEATYEFRPPGEAGGLSASALQGILRYFYTGKLDQLRSLDDCKLIASQSTALKLTTESCGILLAYCDQRTSYASSSGKADRRDKCNVM